MKTTDFLPFVDKFILLSVNSYWKLRLYYSFKNSRCQYDFWENINEFSLI